MDALTLTVDTADMLALLPAAVEAVDEGLMTAEEAAELLADFIRVELV